MARAIGELISRGEPAERIAVLYRTSAIGLYFQSVLKDWGFHLRFVAARTFGRAWPPSWWSARSYICAMGKQQMP